MGVRCFSVLFFDEYFGRFHAKDDAQPLYDQLQIISDAIGIQRPCTAPVEESRPNSRPPSTQSRPSSTNKPQRATPSTPSTPQRPRSSITPLYDTQPSTAVDAQLYLVLAYDL